MLVVVGHRAYAGHGARLFGFGYYYFVKHGLRQLAWNPNAFNIDSDVAAAGTQRLARH